MKIEVLCSAMHVDENTLFSALNLQTDAVVVNQCDRNDYAAYEQGGHTVRMYSQTERGIGRSRNTAILHAKGDIVIFADEDITYMDGYAEMVEEAFRRNPRADMLLFNIECYGGGREECTITRESRVSLFNCLRYGAVRIAVKREALLKSNCFFSLLFGGGARYGAGEDNVFITDCLKKGLKIYTSTQTLCRVDTGSSSWFSGYNEAYFKDKAVLMYTIYKRMAYLYLLPILLKKYRYFKAQCSFIQALRLCWSGIREYQSEVAV